VRVRVGVMRAAHSMGTNHGQSLLRETWRVPSVVLVSCRREQVEGSLRDVNVRGHILVLRPQLSGGCDLPWLMERLALAQTAVLVLSVSMPCTAPRESGTSPRTRAQMASARADGFEHNAAEMAGHPDAPRWPKGWPHPARTACVPLMNGSVRGRLYGRGQINAPLPVMLLLPSAMSTLLQALGEKALGEKAVGESGSSSSSVLVPMGSDMMLEELTAQQAVIQSGLGNLSLEAVQEAGQISAGLRISTKQWSVSLRSPRDRELHAQVRELIDGSSLPARLLVSHLDERHLSCHRDDSRSDHTCTKHADCGVSGDTCVVRKCSAFGFCT